MVDPSSEEGKSAFRWRGWNSSLEEVTFRLIYSFNVNLLTARSVLVGLGDSEVAETGPCSDSDKVKCGILNR